MITELLKSIGLPVKTRSFMVDNVDAAGRCYHKPLQTVGMGAEDIGDDLEIIESIKGSLRQQGVTVSAIMEADGEHELDELERIFNSGDFKKHRVRPLYLDPVLAFGGPAVR